MKSVSFAYYFLVLVFAFTWSSAFAITKLALQVSPPNLFLAMRFLSAAFILLTWAAVRGHFSISKPIPWAGLLALGLLNQAGYNGFTWSGMTTVSSGLATIIISTSPIFIAFFAAPLLDERLTARKLVGLGLGIIGVVFVVRNRITGVGEDLIGITLIAVALLSLVAGTLIFKKWSPDVPLSIVVGVQSMSGGLVLLITGFLTENPYAIEFGPQFYFALAYQAIIVSVAAFALWVFLLRHGSATSASSLHFLMPPLGLIFAWAILGEPVVMADLVGIVPIATGIWLVTHKTSE